MTSVNIRLAYSYGEVRSAFVDRIEDDMLLRDLRSRYAPISWPLLAGALEDGAS